MTSHEKQPPRNPKVGPAKAVSTGFLFNLIFGLIFALGLSVVAGVLTDASWRRRFEGLSVDKYSRVIPPDATRGFRPMWGSVSSLLLPEEGIPWTFDRVEVVQGVVFDESTSLEPAAGFERGAWADVSMEDGGKRCRVRFAHARRWEGILHFSSASGGEYSLPFRVHAGFNDRGFMEGGPPYLKVSFFFFSLFLLVISTSRLKRVVTGAGSADDE